MALQDDQISNALSGCGRFCMNEIQERPLGHPRFITLSTVNMQKFGHSLLDAVPGSSEERCVPEGYLPRLGTDEKSDQVVFLYRKRAHLCLRGGGARCLAVWMDPTGTLHPPCLQTVPTSWGGGRAGVDEVDGDGCKERAPFGDVVKLTPSCLGGMPGTDEPGRGQLGARPGTSQTVQQLVEDAERLVLGSQGSAAGDVAAREQHPASGDVEAVCGGSVLESFDVEALNNMERGVENFFEGLLLSAQQAADGSQAVRRVEAADLRRVKCEPERATYLVEMVLRCCAAGLVGWVNGLAWREGPEAAAAEGERRGLRDMLQRDGKPLVCFR
mmetsp:Transcript_76338/g.205292  ORF Transcript_76338/g.205292 Transcript_76338/m.205292 type:complete len:329 (-) Transcript_76338:124-1110(-)